MMNLRPLLGESANVVLVDSFPYLNLLGMFKVNRVHLLDFYNFKLRIVSISLQD